MNLNYKFVIANEILAASCATGEHGDERAKIAHILFIHYGWKVKHQGTISFMFGNGDNSKWLCEHWDLEGPNGQTVLMEYSDRYPILMENCELSANL